NPRRQLRPGPPPRPLTRGARVAERPAVEIDRRRSFDTPRHCSFAGLAWARGLLFLGAMRNGRVGFVWVVMSAVSSVTAAAPRAGEMVAATEARSGGAAATEDDPLFPGGGHLSVSAATGIPYVGIAEVAVGFHDRIALGLMAGATPYVAGAGLRFRAAIIDG